MWLDTNHHLQAGLFGSITNPIPSLGNLQGGLTSLISRVILLLFTIAGLYVMLNFILAGYKFLTASGNAQKVGEAWAQIWQSILGLVIIAASLLLITVISWILFQDPTFILNPKIYGPD